MTISGVMQQHESSDMTETINKRLLIVDDEQYVLTSLRRLFELKGYDVALSVSPEEALVLMGQIEFAVIISDQKMPGMTGTSFLEYARKLSPDTVRIILTGYAEVDSAIEAARRSSIKRSPVRARLRLPCWRKRAGYRLVWKDEPNPYEKGRMAGFGYLNLQNSLGINVDTSGDVSMTLWGSPAFDAKHAARALELSVAFFHRHLD